MMSAWIFLLCASLTAKLLGASASELVLWGGNEQRELLRALHLDYAFTSPFDYSDKVHVSDVLFEGERRGAQGERMPGSSVLYDLTDMASKSGAFDTLTHYIKHSLKEGNPVSFHLYATPAGTSALAEHSDVYDVVVLQLFGEKSWSMCDGSTHTSSPGELFVIPYGCAHQAFAAGSRMSVHLTVAIEPGSVTDKLSAAFISASRFLQGAAAKRRLGDGP